MQVWTYPEKRMEAFGAVRWDVEWWTAPEGVEEPEDGWGPDNGLDCRHKAFTTEPAAKRYAAKVAGESVFGCAAVTKQVVDWYVEEDRIAEWTNVGESEDVLST